MFKKILLWLFLISLIVGFYGLVKALPEGVSTASKTQHLSNDSVHFLADKTYIDENGNQIFEQEIFDEITRMIQGAEHYILIDMFLFNDFIGTATSSHRQLSKELTDTLIEKKKQNPDIVIQVITDPINTVYGGYESENLKLLEENNIPVILTDLTALRDSNPLYSGFWRTFFQWLPDNKSEHLPNLFDINKPKTSLVSYLNSFNFKANHRKVILADYKKADYVGVSILVTSANPHDGSSRHSNTAIKIDHNLWQDLLKSEKAVASFSNSPFIDMPNTLVEQVTKTVTDEVEVQLLTEKTIKDKIIETIKNLNQGDNLNISMFYISDRDIVNTLKDADKKGVQIKLIFDPNKDAFGREKNGIPNRPVANELMKNTEGNTQIRWCDTHGEQCHSKLIITKQGDVYSLIQGSANLTRRNLDNFNLETNVLIQGSASTTAIMKADQLFTTIWNNENNKTYTTDYQTYAEDKFIKNLIYRFTEFTGISSF